METVDIILAAGPLSETILQIAGNDDNTIFIRTPNNAFLLSASGSRIVFEAVIDTPITANKERILSALLTYNAVWKETGSVRMAMTGNGADALPILIADMITDATFTGENVARLIEDLDAKIQIWRDIIANGADDGSDVIQNDHSVRV
ncbi:MAG: type III secretion system chaperone [Pseudomonadota bacterium]